MRLHPTTRLRWLRPPLLSALKRICELLIAQSEDHRGPRQALSLLQDVREALLLAELPVAALLAQETVGLLDWLIHVAGTDEDESRYLALKATTTLQVYLQDSPSTRGAAAFIPLLNDLRTLRGGRLFCESYFFTPDLSIAPPANREASIELETLSKNARQMYLRRLRSYFQKGFADWLRRPELGAGLELMEAAATRLHAVCAGHASAGLYWVSSALLEALRERALEASVSIRLLLTQVDREIRTLTERGLEACDQPLPEGLMKGLLYYLALARDVGEKVVEVRAAYRLSQLLDEEESPEDAAPSLTALQADADAAAQALARARDILEGLLVGEGAAGSCLAELATILARAADTMALLGIEGVRRTLSQRSRVLEELSTRGAQLSETDLATLAASLLEADQALQGIAEARLNEAITEPEEAARPSEGLAEPLQFARDELAEIRAAISPLIEQTDDLQDPADVVSRFRAVGERLNRHGLEAVAVVIGDCAAYLESLLRSGKPPVTDGQRKVFNEMLVGLDYYLDLRLESGASAEGLLAEIRGWLTMLDMPAPTDDSADLSVEEVEPSEEIALARRQGEEAIPEEVVTEEEAEAITLQVLPPCEEPLPERVVDSIRHAQQVFQSIEGLSVPRSGVPDKRAESVLPAGDLCADSEFIDVFIDNAAFVVATVGEQLARWRANPQSTEAAERLRRAFGSLKGSTRMVGACELGELASGLERMMAAAVATGPSPPLVELLEDVQHALLQTVRSLRQDEPQGPDLEALVTRVCSVRQTLVSSPQQSVERGTSPEGLAASSSETEATAGKQHSLARVPVRMEQLNELTHFAGEISLSRERMARQVGEVRGGLEEMERTLEQLRRHLGKLESEKHVAARGDARVVSGESASGPEGQGDNGTFQQASRGVVESLSHLESLHEALEGLAHDSERTLRQQARVSEDLQRGLVSSRHLPVARCVPRLSRTVSRTAEPLGKQVVLAVDGDNVMLDGQVLRRLVVPLENMLRDAVKHSVESSEERARTGKTLPARMSLSVSASGPEIAIHISDDGRGLDLAAIRKEAVEQGLLPAHRGVSEDELVQLVLEQALIRAPDSPRISGCGTGLELVSRLVKQLGGTLSVNTQPGRGTDVTIRLPAVSTASQLLMTEASGSRYAVPLACVEGVLREGTAELEAAYSGQPSAIDYQGHSYPLAHLGLLLNHDPRVLSRELAGCPVLLVRADELRLALILDRVAERCEMRVEPVGPPASLVGWIGGAAMNGQGKLVLVLDVPVLIRRALAQSCPFPSQLEGEEIPSVQQLPLA